MGTYCTGQKSYDLSERASRHCPSPPASEHTNRMSEHCPLAGRIRVSSVPSATDSVSCKTA